MNTPKKTFDYKWVIMSICFLLIFVCLGFCSGTKSLYLAPVSEALGISRSLYSLSETTRHVTTALFNLFFGTLIYKLGAKKMITAGILSLIGASLSFAYATSIYILCFGGFLLGVGVVCCSTTMVSTIIRRWFTTNIGRYTGIVLASNGIGSAVAAQIFTPIINEEGNPFGYRNSYLLTAGILVVIGVIVLLLLKEQPKDYAIPSTPKQKKAKGVQWHGISFSDAKKKAYFYLACGCTFLTGLSLQGTSGIYAAHLKDVGLSSDLIANVVSTYAICLTLSKLVVGFLYDRFGLRSVMVMCQGAAVLAFTIILLITPTRVGIGLAFAFGILLALALPLETLVIPLITNDLFGTTSYEKILGIFMAMNYAGYALGSPVTNLSYDQFGSYKPAVAILAVLMLATLILYQFIIKAAYKDKNTILASE